MKESITFSRIQTEIIRELPHMSKIKLLFTWMSALNLEKSFPKNNAQIKILLKKIEAQFASKNSDKLK